MRVLFYHKNLNVGGAERAVAEILSGLRRRDIQAMLVTGKPVASPDWVDSSWIVEPGPRERNGFADRIKHRLGFSKDKTSHVQVKRSLSRLKNTLGIDAVEPLEQFWIDTFYSERLRRFVAAVRQSKPEIIVTSLIESGHTLMLAAIASQQINLDQQAWVAIEQNATSRRFEDYYENPKIRSAWHAVTKAAYQTCDIVVGVSDGVCIGLQNDFQIPKDKTVRVYNPVDCQAVQNSPELDPNEKPGCGYLLNVGRLHTQKNQTNLIRAFAQIQDEIQQELWIAGDGKLHQELSDLADQLGVGKRVKLLGNRSDVWTLMKSADLYVHSANYEGIGLAWIEAMAAGCPVVVTDCDFGPRELMVDGQNGRLVPVENVDALASAMQSLANDKATAAELGKKGLESLPKFNLEQISSEYLAVFENALAQAESSLATNGIVR